VERLNQRKKINVKIIRCENKKLNSWIFRKHFADPHKDIALIP